MNNKLCCQPRLPSRILRNQALPSSRKALAAVCTTHHSSIKPHQREGLRVMVDKCTVQTAASALRLGDVRDGGRMRGASSPC